jgi:hypothetical protein
MEYLIRRTRVVVEQRKRKAQIQMLNAKTFLKPVPNDIVRYEQIIVCGVTNKALHISGSNAGIKIVFNPTCDAKSDHDIG